MLYKIGGQTGCFSLHSIKLNGQETRIQSRQSRQTTELKLIHWKEESIQSWGVGGPG